MCQDQHAAIGCSAPGVPIGYELPHLASVVFVSCIGSGHRVKNEQGSTQVLSCGAELLPSLGQRGEVAAFETYLCWLQRHDQTRPKQLKAYLSQFNSEIDRALLFLRELNLEEWHDSPLNTGGDYDLIRMIDKHVHPAYLRLVEGVFTPLLRPLAQFSRIHRNKGVEGLDVWSIPEGVHRYLATDSPLIAPGYHARSHSGPTLYQLRRALILSLPRFH